MWPDPTRMTDEALDAELTEIAAKIADADANGSKIGELQSRLFRLRAEMAFRRGKGDEMADFPFNNDASQAERKRVLENDRKVSSYMAHATANVDEDRGGRYAATGSSPTVTGATPISYPTQPSHSPWHHDPISDEPPLGYSVEDHDAVGEQHERAGSAVPVEPTNRMDTAGTAAAAPALSHVVTGVAAVKSRRRM
jgi:hypothetical protein